jgi:hypothetical protein
MSDQTPASKAALLNGSDAEFSKLLAYVDGLTPEQREAEFSGLGRDRNVRDVLAHLHAWHVLLLGWNEDAAIGLTPELPAPGYSWSDLDALNSGLREGFAPIPLDEIRGLLEASHAEVGEFIAAQSDDELFTEGALAWTGSSTLAELIDECTGVHYRWADATIRRGLGS